MQPRICKIFLPLVAILIQLIHTSKCQDRQGYTDLELAVLSGVPPDRELAEAYYNETDTVSLESHGLQSAPGCPKLFQGHPWVYYGDPPKCHLSGYRWPCGANMKLFAQTSSTYGYCDCDCKIFRGEEVNPPQAYCYGETKEGNARTLVHVKEWDSCHSLFDQAECPEGQWLVFGDDPKQGPYCDERMCPETVDKYRFYFYDYRRKVCHRLRDKCSIGLSEADVGVVGHEGRTNRISFRYRISTSDWIPRCDIDELADSPGGNRFYSSSINRIACGNGLRFSPILARCLPIQGKLTYDIG